MSLLLQIPVFTWANVHHSLPEEGQFKNSLIGREADVHQPAPGQNGVRKVVLDAGHGGKDVGCSGRNVNEKEIALDITLRLGQLIRKHHPDVEVIYTRKTDEFVALHERAALANKSRADLFVSIHCNTTEKRNSAIGTETFVLGLHRADDNLKVAKRENSVIVHEQNYQQHYEGYDPNSDEGHITLSMFQNAYLEQSITLANYIENEFQHHGQRVSRGVKQAGFLVLRQTVMPSVLIETGFLNNSKEELILTSEEGKERTAMAIFNAFSKYKMETDRLAAQQGRTEVVAAEKPLPKQEVAFVQPTPKVDDEPTENYVEKAKREIERMQQKDQKPQSAQAPVTSQPQPPARNTPAVANSATVSSSTKPAQSQPATEKPVAKPSPSQTSTEKPVAKPQPQNEAVARNEPQVESNIQPREKKLEYVVQLSASSKKIKTAGTIWQNLDDLLIRYENNLYKYQVGAIATYDEAVRQRDKLRARGFKDCFVVAYYNDVQVNIKEALTLASAN